MTIRLGASGSWLGSGVDGDPTTLHYEWQHSISGTPIWASGIYGSGCVTLLMSGVVYAKLCDAFYNELPDPSGLYPLYLPSGEPIVDARDDYFSIYNTHYVNINPDWRYKYMKLAVVTYNEIGSGINISWWPPSE